MEKQFTHCNASRKALFLGLIMLLAVAMAASADGAGAQHGYSRFLACQQTQQASLKNPRVL
jgi:hypothetical protein